MTTANSTGAGSRSRKAGRADADRGRLRRTARGAPDHAAASHPRGDPGSGRRARLPAHGPRDLRISRAGEHQQRRAPVDRAVENPACRRDPNRPRALLVTDVPGSAALSVPRPELHGETDPALVLPVGRIAAGGPIPGRGSRWRRCCRPETSWAGDSCRPSRWSAIPPIEAAICDADLVVIRSQTIRGAGRDRGRADRRRGDRGRPSAARTGTSGSLPRTRPYQPIPGDDARIPPASGQRHATAMS